MRGSGRGNALRFADTATDELSDTASRSGTLAHLVDVNQAAALFWLPVPGTRGLPGLPLTQRPREIWRAPSDAAATSNLVLGDNVAGIRHQPITLSQDDRKRHAYIIGQTGTGKSTLLLNLVTQDIAAGRGVAVIDPHGDLISDVLARIPQERVDDVILIDPADRERPVGFNFLECAEEDRDQVTESFLSLIRQLFDPDHHGFTGPLLEHALRHGLLTAMAVEGMTLIEVIRILTDKHFAERLLPHITDPLVRRYWTDEVARTTDFHKSEMLGYVASKFSPFTTNKLVRHIIGQSHSSFDLRTVMDEGRILLVDLAQGRLGQYLSTLLGSVIVSKLLLAALSRANVPPDQRRDFGLYVDEFQHYATPAFIDIVSGGRKYGLNITMAHQHLGQLPDAVRGAILGNVGTTIAFRTGINDAALLAAAMQPSAFDIEDYIELPNYRAIARVLADGRYDPCFTLAARPQTEGKEHSWAEGVRALSRLKYGRSRELVEAEIAERADLGENDDEDEDDPFALIRSW